MIMLRDTCNWFLSVKVYRSRWMVWCRQFGFHFSNWPQSTIFTDFLVCPLSDPTFSMARTTSIPLMTFPNTTCFPSNHSVFSVQRKNWDPFVFGPFIVWKNMFRGREKRNMNWDWNKFGVSGYSDHSCRSNVSYQHWPSTMCQVLHASEWSSRLSSGPRIYLERKIQKKKR